MLQARSQDMLVSNVRAKVVKVLQAAAIKSHDPRLSELSVKSRMDAFGNLKKTIQTMVDRLLKEKEDEIKHKDFCVEQLNENARATEVATQSKNDADAKIAEFQAALDVLDKEIAQLKADVAELNKQAKMAGEDREKEYEEFVQDTNDTVEEKKKEIANKSQVRAKTDAKMLDEEVNLDQIMSSLDQLATENGDIHRSCDFVLKNWEVRTAARDAEVEALKQAIALFSGAKMAALLQHY